MSATKKLNSFTGINYGQKATLSLPTGVRYDEIHIETNLSKEQLKKVSISLGGDEFYSLSGTEIRMLEQYKQIEHTEGLFIIPFRDTSARTNHGVHYTSLETEQGDNLVLEIEIADSNQDNAPTIQLNASATVSPSSGTRVVLPTIGRQIMQAGGTENEFTTLNSSPNLLVRRIHFATDKATKLKIQRDSIVVHESNKFLESGLAKKNDRTWQPNYYHFDPIMDGFYINKLFPTVHKNELKFTVSTSSPVPTIQLLVEGVRIVRPELT